MLTELGYNQSLRAASEPAIVGSFLWKWFPEPQPVGRNFQLATSVMRSVIREAWWDDKVGQPVPDEAGLGD